MQVFCINLGEEFVNNGSNLWANHTVSEIPGTGQESENCTFDTWRGDFGKQSEARIIDAKGNLQSAKIFVQAADELGGNPVAVQLQWYECLKSISAEKQSTIIVPDSMIKF